MKFKYKKNIVLILFDKTDNSDTIQAFKDTQKLNIYL